MNVQVAKSSRAEAVRRRRRQQVKRRYDAVSRAASTVRPLVSRPRTTAGSLRPVTGRFGSLRRRSVRARLEDLIALRLPALPRIQPSWRLASLSMLLLLGAMLGRLLSDPHMYIRGINLGGAALVPGEEIYAAAGVADQHIFWVNPARVQRRVAAVPGIASAQVSVEWPNTVTILVTERIPVVEWIEGKQKWWVDADGQKFQARTDLMGMLPITVDDADEAVRTAPVPVEAIWGALQLRELRPNIELLHYDREHGLSYQDGRGWRGYFGMGTDMPQKLAVYERLTEDLTARGIHPRKISVENYAAPYYVR